jgi:putative membrane protein
MWNDGWGMHGWGGWWGMLVLLLVLFLLLAGVVLLAVSLARSGGGAGSSREPGTSAADRLLDERYARGEIDEQEYLHRRAVLRGR